jgi:transcriptional regulator of acetoin/glycerol metabolism
VPEIIATPEWLSVSTRQHNAILEGPEHAAEDLLLLLEPSLRTPAIRKRAPIALELPTEGCGALVLRNVSELDRDEQAALLRWLDAERKQVVSTTARPLFPLIAKGLFDEALYYRLNITLMRFDSTGAPLDASSS